VVKWQTRTF